jgi:hypothetical protein
LNIAPDARHARLLAAAAVGAFRVGLEMWIENARLDLPDLIARNVEILTRSLYDNDAL